MTDPAFKHPAAPAALAALRPLMGDRISAGPSIRALHGAGESWLPAAPPDLVALAETAEEVSRILATCNALGLPAIPFGAGSSIEGQIHAPLGGLSLDLSGMARILRIGAEDMDCTVQCGVTRQRLNEELRATGLFFPVDLGAEATLGGMASTRASGTTTVRYGSMRELVLGLTVVLPDGRIVRTGGRARKSAAGYDLTHLFVGAEGTLGVITELTLRLFGQPEARQTLLCSFPDIAAATATVVATLQCGLGLNRIELADRLQMQAINAHCGSGLPDAPALCVELVGSPPPWRMTLACSGVSRRMPVFSSPGNPAGPAITATDFARLIAGTPPETLVVFDEAYVEYLDPEARFDALAMLAASGLAWISLRTFSKAHGLAGARVGYGVAHAAGLVAAMAKARNPVAVNTVAEAAALAALGDDGHLAQGVALARAERRRVSAALAATGVTCAPSQTNFLFFDCGGPAAETAERLRQRGILIKARMEPPFETYARVTMGTLDENDLFLGALHKIRESR